MKFSWPSPWVPLLCWSITTLRSSLLTRSPFIIKEDTSGTARWKLCSGQSVGKGAELPCPLQAWLFHLPREALWTLSFGELWKLQYVGTIDHICGHGWWIWPQPLCPPCRSGWDWKFQPSHGGSPGNSILVLSKGFPKSPHWWNKTASVAFHL